MLKTFFQKKKKKKKNLKELVMRWKNARSSGKTRCTCWHPKVPIDTPQVPISTQPNHDLITLFCVFGHYVGLFWLYFSLQKNGCAVKFLKNSHGVSNWGILAMSHPFFKNYHLHHLFQKEKRKLTKPRFFKIMHLFSKLRAFGYALSPF